MAAAAKISLFLGFIVASIVLQSMSSNADYSCNLNTPRTSGSSCAGVQLNWGYMENAFVECPRWCNQILHTTDNRIKCAQIDYQAESFQHVCSCYTECPDQ
ncbi:hypothetical protein MKW94_011215 [Papaver nudicaule]|uniref:Uncharacterized protein n=1 Tax=Papaver nudicaule TaxID=74823 RepID=A0AA41S8Y7_PAPNU|nr:hypothetical protein [Papaver nudicaule]